MRQLLVGIGIIVACYTGVAIGMSTERTSRQANIHQWVKEAFGEYAAGNRTERIARILEEVFELAQAEGFPKERIPTLVEYVYGRDVGEPFQEVGGIAVTLLAYGACVGIDIDEAERTEVERVLAKPIAHFKARKAQKVAAGIACGFTAPNSSEEP